MLWSSSGRGHRQQQLGPRRCDRAQQHGARVHHLLGDGHEDRIDGAVRALLLHDVPGQGSAGRGSRGFLTPLAASPDPLREPRYTLCVDPPHTRPLWSAGACSSGWHSTTTARPAAGPSPPTTSCGSTSRCRRTAARPPTSPSASGPSPRRWSVEHLVGDDIHRYPMSLTSLEQFVSKLANSDACPRPTTGQLHPRRAPRRP